LAVDDLVNEVLRRNPTATAAEAAWEAARSLPQQSRSLDDPLLSYAVAPATLGDDELDDGHRITFSQKLPWPGKRDLRGRRATHRAEAERHRLEAVRRRLTRDARQAYFEYYYIFRAIEVNDANFALLKTVQRLAETKYAAGTASKQDALQAKVERYHLEHRGIMLERMREVARARINRLLHRAPRSPLPPPISRADPPGARPAPPETLTERAVDSRPELQALVEQWRARQVAYTLAKRESFPDFNLLGAYNSIWQNEDQRWLVGLGINLPIQLGRRRAARLEALAETKRLAAEWATRTDAIAHEVTEAHARLVETAHVIALYEREFRPAAQENASAARAGYAAGKNDVLALLAAEKHSMLVELAYHRALADYHQQQAELTYAAGRAKGDPSKPRQPEDQTTSGETHHE